MTLTSALSRSAGEGVANGEPLSNQSPLPKGLG